MTLSQACFRLRAMPRVGFTSTWAGCSVRGWGWGVGLQWGNRDGQLACGSASARARCRRSVGARLAETLGWHFVRADLLFDGSHAQSLVQVDVAPRRGLTPALDQHEGFNAHACQVLIFCRRTFTAGCIRNRTASRRIDRGVAQTKGCDTPSREGLIKAR